MKDHEVPFKDAKTDRDGTTELKKRGLIDKLLQYGPEHLKARSISIVNGSRINHRKIPYSEIGEALRHAAANLTNEQLGKIFLK